MTKVYCYKNFFIVLFFYNVNMVLEGGSVEVDGHGTLIAAKSSVVSSNRDPNMTVEEAEECLKKYYGVLLRFL